MATNKTKQATETEVATPTPELNGETVEQTTPPKLNPNAAFADFEIPDRFKDPRTFVLCGVTFMDSYTDRDKVKQTQVTSRLPDPFGDEDFVDVPIAPKWANSGGIFKYRAKKALRSTTELRYPVIVTPVTFYSKKAKRELMIAGLFIKNPFDDGYIEFHVHSPRRDQEEAAVFAMLVSKRWSLSLDVAPTTDDDEDIPF